MRLDPAIAKELEGIPHDFVPSAHGGASLVVKGRTVWHFRQRTLCGKGGGRDIQNGIAAIRRALRGAGIEPNPKVTAKPTKEEPVKNVSEATLTLVWTALLALADENDIVKAGNLEIAAKAGVSSSTVTHSLAHIEAAGAMVRVETDPAPGKQGIAPPQHILLAHLNPDFRRVQPKETAPVSQPSIANVTEAAIVLPVKEPRKPTPAENRKIMDAVEAAYAGEKIGYRAGQSDEAVAKALNLPRAWITAVREQFYGPERVIDLAGLNKRMSDLAGKLTDIEARMNHERDASKRALDALNAEFVAISNTLKGIA